MITTNKSFHIQIYIIVVRLDSPMDYIYHILTLFSIKCNTHVRHVVFIRCDSGISGTLPKHLKQDLMHIINTNHIIGVRYTFDACTPFQLSMALLRRSRTSIVIPLLGPQTRERSPRMLVRKKEEKLFTLLLLWENGYEKYQG